MSNTKNKYYVGFMVVLVTLVVYVAFTFQYTKVSADTFHNEIETVVYSYSDSVTILHEGDDSKEDSVSHPLNKAHIQQDVAMNADTLFTYTSVQNHTYILSDMGAGVGYYGYKYETAEQALTALQEVEVAFTNMGIRPVAVNGVATYQAINPDDPDNVTYWQVTSEENSLYMLMVDGYINGLGGSPPIYKVFEDILSKMS